MIRPATVADAADVAHVHVSSWRSTYRGLMPDAVLEGLSTERRAEFWRGLRERPKKQFVFVIEDEGHIVGFVNGGPEQEPDPYYTGELYALYLLREYQGRGYGKALFRTTVETFTGRGHTAMLLWVLSSNPSRGFYEAQGGRYLKTNLLELSGETLEEVAYGWDNLPSLFR